MGGEKGAVGPTERHPGYARLRLQLREKDKLPLVPSLYERTPKVDTTTRRDMPFSTMSISPAKNSSITSTTGLGFCLRIRFGLPHCPFCQRVRLGGRQ